MTLKELYEYRELDKEIAEDQTRLESVKAADGCGDSLVREISDKIRRRNSKLRRIYIFIERIPDAHTRRIFKLRFIDGLSWNSLAHKIGGTTADAARMTVKRYLREK